MKSGVGSTGVPCDRSIIPKRCWRARSPKGASASHGKSGSFSARAFTRSLLEQLQRQRDLYLLGQLLLRHQVNLIQQKIRY